MKLAHVVLLLIISNIMFVGLDLFTQNTDIDTAISDFQDKTSGVVIDLDSFVGQAADSTIYSNAFAAGVASAFQNALNIATIGLKVIGLIIGSFISFPIDVWQQQGLFIFEFIGFTAWLIITWINVFGAIRIYSYIKGASQ